MALFFLIGMPAAGKTYWGKRIAEHFSMPFYDLDNYIELRENTTISSIFEKSGEPVFRELEHHALKHLIESTRTNTIVACGGGTPCFHNNMQLMKQAGQVIFLNSSTNQIIENINKSDTIRPLLTEKDNIKTVLNDLLSNRKSVYEQAHHILHPENISLSTFAEIINSCTNRQ